MCVFDSKTSKFQRIGLYVISSTLVLIPAAIALELDVFAIEMMLRICLVCLSRQACNNRHYSAHGEAVRRAVRRDSTI